MASSCSRGGAGAGDGGAGDDGVGRNRNPSLVFNPLPNPPNLHLGRIGLGLLALNLTMETMKSSEARAIEKSKTSEAKGTSEPKLDCTYTVQQFFKDKKENVDPMGNGLVRKVFIPTKDCIKRKLKLTDEASTVTTSLVHCVTRELAARRSWDGDLDLSQFAIVDGTVHAIVKPPKKLATSSAIQENGKSLASILKTNFKFDGLLPPYFSHLISLLENIPAGGLEDWRRTAIDTHCALMTLFARICLSVLLKVCADGLTDSDQEEFYFAVSMANCSATWLNDVLKIDELKKVSSYEVNGVKTQYNGTDRKSGFMYIRNHSTHIIGHLKAMGKRFNEDAELLIPEIFGDFLSEIMMHLLQSRLSKLVAKIAKNSMSCSSLPVDFESNTTTILKDILDLPAVKEVEIADAKLNSPPVDAIVFGDMGPQFAPSGPPILLEKDRTRGGWGGGVDSILLLKIRRIQHLEEQLATAREHVAELEQQLQLERP